MHIITKFGPLIFLSRFLRLYLLPNSTGAVFSRSFGGLQVKFRIAASTCLLLLALAVTASASPVGLLGSGSSGTLDATLVSLTWTADSAALPLPGPPWNEDVNSAAALTFAGCTPGVLGSAGCLV